MLPKAHLTSHSRMSGSSLVTTPSWLSRSLRPFLYSSSIYSCQLLISYTFFRSLLILSFIMPILSWSFPLISPIFLKRSLLLPILLFSSISLNHSLKKVFLSVMALLWNSAFSWVNLSLSPFPFASLLSSAIYKASSDNHFAFLHFLFFGMVLVTASCTMLGTSIHTLSRVDEQIQGIRSDTLSYSPANVRGRPVKLLSRVRLFATPWTVAYQAPPSMGFSRQEYWSELPGLSPSKPHKVNEYWLEFDISFIHFTISGIRTHSWLTQTPNTTTPPRNTGSNHKQWSHFGSLLPMTTDAKSPTRTPEFPESLGLHPTP